MKSSGIGQDAMNYFLEYAAQFLGNLGNYKSFGDVKFIPRCSKADVEKLCVAANIEKELRAQCLDGMFVDDGINESAMLFGFPDQGHVSGYYPDSPGITQTEIEAVGSFVGGKGLLPENTRIRKTKDGNYEILIASAVTHPPAHDIDTTETSWTIDVGRLKGKQVTSVYGDHQEEMAKIALNIKKAAQHAANDTQRAMMNEYAKSFSTGSLLAFKESQKLWVKDLGPDVESNIGFIETYRDPAGIRGEWEGFVAMVNKERTLAFKKLVDAAPTMIPKLPWSAAFEKDTFTPPDFTSLEVLSFACSGLPAGINIPNYDDIRQTCGFKNVSLGNVLSAKTPNDPIPFIHPRDLAVYTANRDAAFELQVGIHELLGHGTGKLLQETSPGVFNFDHTNPPLNPLTHKPISTYYAPQETYSTVFGPTASSYEECRAECVAMVLACDPAILHIFGFGDGTENLDGPAGDVLYTAYLSMARAGILALEFWDPKSGGGGEGKWGQIHMQARFSILKTFLEAGDGRFCWLEHQTSKGEVKVAEGAIGVEDDDDDDDDYDLSDLIIRLDRAKILTHGRPAVAKYLLQLHVYKATADVEAGRALYESRTRVEGGFWARRVRGEVLRKKVARKVFVMGNTVVGGNDGGEGKEREVVLREYDASPEGMIRSWVERDV